MNYNESEFNLKFYCFECNEVTKKNKKESYNSWIWFLLTSSLYKVVNEINESTLFSVLYMMFHWDNLEIILLNPLSVRWKQKNTKASSLIPHYSKIYQ